MALSLCYASVNSSSAHHPPPRPTPGHTHTKGRDFKPYSIMHISRVNSTDMCIEDKPKNLAMLCLKIINCSFVIRPVMFKQYRCFDKWHSKYFCIFRADRNDFECLNSATSRTVNLARNPFWPINRETYNGQATKH